jgi:hypothetical protein
MDGFVSGLRNFWVASCLIFIFLLSGCGRDSVSKLSLAPSGFSYRDASVIYTRGWNIVPNTPTSSGGAIAAYSVSPPLPQGLLLDAQTGVITGIPAEVSPSQVYTVIGSNGGGSVSTGLNIEVAADVMAPATLTYSQNPVTWFVGESISPDIPSASGGEITMYTAQPALPAGLVLDPQTGVISGTPTAVTAAANYTVTGSNNAGSVSVVVNVTVAQRIVAPASLGYSDSDAVYTVGTVI